MTSESDQVTGPDRTDGNHADEPGYTEAMAELERILASLESDRVDVDVISRQVARAAHLIELCRGKIRRAEIEVERVVAGLEDPPD